MVGEAADSLRDMAGYHRRLREMRVAGVEDDRRPLGQLVVEGARQARVPAFRHARREPRLLAFIGIVVDVEMGRREHLKLEAVVLDLVGSEVLG